MHPVTIILFILFVIAIIYFMRLGSKTGGTHKANPHDTYRLWDWFRKKQ
ncbi:hypothetical protein [Alkalicoccus daliensis]|uniref:Uncharacterized protein n=1 Tax=Alkalicoccus daliensis TaxID=745820 RepID=A0A1H0D5L9_9BACI|nr:hypothetical protein [Alkalicoccus daliensis]SDN65433.1 hypothetical protein SAMN04488053_102351 [Alkalicoccus daliensis]